MRDLRRLHFGALSSGRWDPNQIWKCRRLSYQLTGRPALTFPTFNLTGLRRVVVLSQSFVGTALDRHLLVVRLPSVCLGAACQTSNIACSLRLAWQTFMRSIAHFLLCCKSFNLMFSTTGSVFIDKHHHMMYNRCGWGRVEFPPPTAAPARGRGKMGIGSYLSCMSTTSYPIMGIVGSTSTYNVPVMSTRGDQFAMWANQTNANWKERTKRECAYCGSLADQERVNCSQCGAPLRRGK
jgi:hypothetical protein